MNIDQSIFKAYDIRGIYPEQISKETTYAIGRAYCTWLRKQDPEAHTIAVGGDMRISTPELKESLIQGVIDSGMNVDDLGLVSSPTFYYGVAQGGYAGGLQVSASHNPAEYNGVKVVGRGASPIGKNNGMYEIRDLIVKDELGEVAAVKGVYKRGEHVMDALNSSLDYYLLASGADLERIKSKNFVIALDPANAMGVLDFGLSGLMGRLPVKAEFINNELDGTFPAHEADPLKEENTADLRKLVVDVGADLGIATDGDADRIFFIDNEGNSVPQAIIRGILAQIELETNPGETICYDIRPGRITKDLIEAAGGKPVVTPVGHTLIKNEMDKTGAIFGGESSGHFFYKMPFGIFEMSVLVAIKIIDWLAKSEKTFAELVAPYKKYIESGEINIRVKDQSEVTAAIEKVRVEFKDLIASEMDGVYIETPEVWFLVRGSNTEPLLRVSLEGTTQESVNAMKDKILEVIK